MSVSASSHLGRSNLIFVTETSITSSGLFGFGLCAILVNLFEAGLFPIAPALLALGVFYGGASQIVVGLMEWHRRNVFGAATFVCFGLFWISLVGFLVLPEAGYGSLPAGTVLSAYLLFWGAFTGLLLVNAAKISRPMRWMLVLLLGYFGLLFLSEATSTPFVSTLGRYCGLASGVAALYAGATLIIQHIQKYGPGR